MGEFQTALICEDVREEIGGKKSLMGLFPGHIVVQFFPATIQLAFYFEYKRSEPGEQKIELQFRFLLDDVEIAKGVAGGELSASDVVLPIALAKGLLTFEKPSTIKIMIAVNGGAEEEILSKQLVHGTISPSSSATPPPA